MLKYRQKRRDFVSTIKKVEAKEIKLSSKMGEMRNIENYNPILSGEINIVGESVNTSIPSQPIIRRKTTTTKTKIIAGVLGLVLMFGGTYTAYKVIDNVAEQRQAIIALQQEKELIKENMMNLWPIIYAAENTSSWGYIRREYIEALARYDEIYNTSYVKEYLMKTEYGLQPLVGESGYQYFQTKKTHLQLSKILLENQQLIDDFYYMSYPNRDYEVDRDFVESIDEQNNNNN
jgi:hypothetical protein